MNLSDKLTRRYVCGHCWSTEKIDWTFYDNKHVTTFQCGKCLQKNLYYALPRKSHP